jgi:UDP-N-acetylglucosamine--N-acetylmuramyl-(pentapeptide) pyrophosphoryl-undecaprenol N-acetylglucosamine transferase
MAESFRNSHLVICRAGAGSLAELAAAGKAAFLIPLVSKDRHQEFNAGEIAHLGAALTELQGKLTGQILAEQVKGLYSDRAKLKSLSHRMAALHKPDAAIQIARGILEG